MTFRFLCHGRSERCLTYGEYQFPLCSRCTGIYIGFFVALIYEYLFSLPSSELIPLFAVMIVPTAIDGVTQLLRDRESTNPIRFSTGLLAGVGLMFVIRIARNIL